MMSDNQIFAPQQVWDHEYKGIKNNLDAYVDENDKVSIWLNKFLAAQPGQGKSILEIGCFPGRYLFHFGKHQYELNGIDITDEMDGQFSQWLRGKGFTVGDIEKADVFKYQPPKKYDIVASFGFIEHFSNFTDLIKQQISWTKPGGFTIISVPDFANPVQGFFHKLADKELLSIHNLKAMDLKAWKEALKGTNTEIIFEGHFGGYAFWAGQQKRNIFQKLIVKTGYFLNNTLSGKIKKSSPLYSPFMGIILKKALV
jgi:SAM-dependent methyltransferase